MIIGKAPPPPYIAKGQWKGLDYRWRGYRTQNCPDLYASCVERASTLLNDQGRIAMVVMHNLCFSKDFQPLRDHLTSVFSSLWVSSYDRWSDSLFSKSAKVRNSILVSSRQGEQGLSATRCHRWLADQRHYLFNALEYLPLKTPLPRVGGFTPWPFVDHPQGSLGLWRTAKQQ